LVEDRERSASEITSEIVFLLLLLLHLVLLVHASLAQSVYTMNSLPVSSEGWSLPSRPTMPPSSDLVRLEHSFTSKNLRFKKTAVQRGSPSWIWQHGTEARTAGDAKVWWLCNQCSPSAPPIHYSFHPSPPPQEDPRLCPRGQPSPYALPTVYSIEQNRIIFLELIVAIAPPPRTPPLSKKVLFLMPPLPNPALSCHPHPSR
jgi:hypothetical protein